MRIGPLAITTFAFTFFLFLTLGWNNNINNDNSDNTSNNSDRSVVSLLTTVGRFPKISDPFPGIKLEVSSGCLAESSIFKLMMTDDVTLWSKLESRLRKAKSILLVLFHRRTIFKMLALEQSPENWLFSAGGGRPTAAIPLGYGPE